MNNPPGAAIPRAPRSSATRLILTVVIVLLFATSIILRYVDKGTRRPHQATPAELAAIRTDNDRAHALFAGRKYVDAEAAYRALLKQQEHLLGPEHSDTLRSLHQLALSLLAQNKLEAAREFARRALEGRRKLLGPDAKETKDSQRLLDELPPPK